MAQPVIDQMQEPTSLPLQIATVFQLVLDVGEQEKWTGYEVWESVFGKIAGDSKSARFARRITRLTTNCEMLADLIPRIPESASVDAKMKAAWLKSLDSLRNLVVFPSMGKPMKEWRSGINGSHIARIKSIHVHLLAIGRQEQIDKTVIQDLITDAKSLKDRLQYSLFDSMVRAEFISDLDELIFMLGHYSWFGSDGVWDANAGVNRTRERYEKEFSRPGNNDVERATTSLSTKVGKFLKIAAAVGKTFHSLSTLDVDVTKLWATGEAAETFAERLIKDPLSTLQLPAPSHPQLPPSSKDGK